jgi:hypothetical protein
MDEKTKIHIKNKIEDIFPEYCDLVFNDDGSYYFCPGKCSSVSIRELTRLQYHLNTTDIRLNSGPPNDGVSVLIIYVDTYKNY